MLGNSLWNVRRGSQVASNRATKWENAHKVSHAGGWYANLELRLVAKWGVGLWNWEVEEWAMEMVHPYSTWAHRHGRHYVSTMSLNGPSSKQQRRSSSWLERVQRISKTTCESGNETWETFVRRVAVQGTPNRHQRRDVVVDDGDLIFHPILSAK